MCYLCYRCAIYAIHMEYISMEYLCYLWNIFAIYGIFMLSTKYFINSILTNLCAIYGIFMLSMVYLCYRYNIYRISIEYLVNIFRIYTLISHQAAFLVWKICWTMSLRWFPNAPKLDRRRQKSAVSRYCTVDVNRIYEYISISLWCFSGVPANDRYIVRRNIYPGF